MKIPVTHIFSYHRARVFFSKTSHYGGYINMLFLLGISLWLYIFVGKYFIGLKDDFAFIEENIPNVSYIQLYEAEFKEVYRKHEKKLDGKEKSAQDIKSPF